MKLLLLLSLFPLLSQGQPAASKPEDLGSVLGKVLNAATGEPLRKANLILRRGDGTTGSGPAGPGLMPTSYSATSDDTGAFVLKDVEPGSYRLTVNRTGFVATEYGARRLSMAGGGGATLTVDRGQRIQGLVFRLLPHAVITGRVMDADGDPVANVAVQPMRFRYVNGRKQLIPSGGGSTNDLGEYRIFGVAPGRYFISAAYRMIMMDAPEESFVPTYYPGTIDASSAMEVEATPGAQIRGIDFVMTKTRTVRVRGRLQNLVAGLRGPVQLMLMPREGLPMRMNPTMVPIGPTNQSDFEMRNVVPGSYTLTAYATDGEKRLTVRQRIEVGNKNVEDVVVALAPGMQIAGSIRVDGAEQPDLANIYIGLRPRGPGNMMGPTTTGRPKDDGNFVLLDVSPDDYTLFLSRLPDGYYVKSVSLGGQDALESGINLTSGAPASIGIVLSPGAGQVEGTVLNGEQKPTPGATVVLIPKNEKVRDDARFYRNGTTDQYGRFSLKNTDPGEYRLFAWEDMEPGAHMDPDFVKLFESNGVSLSLRENSRENVHLKLIPAAEPLSPPQGFPAPSR